MLRVLTNQALREQKILRWASVGLPIFITAFVWAPSRDGLEGVYALAFFLPMLLVLPRQKPQLNHYGGMPTLIAILFAGYATQELLPNGVEAEKTTTSR